MQTHARGVREIEIAVAKVTHFLDARAGIVEKQEERAVADRVTALGR